MEPASILAIVNTSIGLTAKIATVTKDLYDLAKRYKDAELNILSIAEECEIIRLAWRKIEKWCRSWANTDFADMELLERLDRSLAVGIMIMSALEKDIEPLKEFTESSGFIQRAKVLCKDNSFQTYQTRIRGQVGALSLLLEAIKLPSIEDRHELLVHKEHILRSSDESVYSLFDAESRAFRYSTDNLSLESTELVYRRLDFENDLFTSKVYKRNYGYSAKSREVVQSIQKDHPDRRIEDGLRRPEQDQVEIDGSLDNGTSGGNATGTDLATDVSRRADRILYSIPEDGSPVTFNTKKGKEKRDREQEGTLTKTSHQSQTSPLKANYDALIAYYEGGKGPNVHLRPSVRVKVTPSGARKIKDTNEQIQITTAGSSRKPSYTRRISLGPRNTADRQIAESADDRSISSYTSAAEESSLAGRYPPVEIEVMHRDQGSDLSVASASRQRYIQQIPSEVSSIPTDSMLEENTGSVTPRRQRSRSFSKGAVSGTHDTLKTPSRRRSRSLSKERLAHQVMEKLEGKSRDASSGKRRHGSKHRSRSVSNEQIVGMHRLAQQLETL